MVGFFFSSRRRHTRYIGDWSSDVCSSDLARNLGIKLFEIPITEAFQVFKAQFKEVFKGLPENETEENMQPRLRARSEERRVGKECGSGWAREHERRRRVCDEVMQREDDNR